MPAAIGIASAAYAGYALTHSAAQAVNGVTCHVTPDRSGFSATLDSSGASPASVCACAWRNGQLGVSAGAPLPDWVACAGEGDGVDVFPGTDPALCDRLGLAPLPGRYEPAARHFAAMREELASLLSRAGCANQTTARAETRQVLDRHRFSVWTIQSHGFAAASPCAVASFDTAHGVVTLSGQVRPELTQAVQRVIEARCGSQQAVASAVDAALAQAGFGSWDVAVSHRVTGSSLCVAGFDPRPETLTVVLTLYRG